MRTDVEILHQIVLRAQQRHDVRKRPKRALFEAYERVFAENGLDTTQDRACLRIVLQLGEPQIPGDLLYDKFEYVLRQIGVQLAFGDDDLPAHNDYQSTARTKPIDETVENGSLLHTSPRRPTRRASFTSIHDITSEQIRQSKSRQLSRASESRLQDERAPLAIQQQNIASLQMLHEAQPSKQRRYSYDSPSPKRHGMKDVYRRGLHVPKDQSFRDGRPEAHLERRVLQRYSRDDILAGSELERSPWKLYPQETFYQPPSMDLNRHAETFSDVRLRNLQKNLLHRWIRYARERSEHIHAIELQAVAKDFLTLKRQAFDFWRAAHEQKRQRDREERFFERLHNRAGQAYDLYLLTKSFTHWIQITAAAVAKTNAARRKFLFTKYFNAWYEFTVTNELKAERHGLKAPLNLIRKRAARYYRDQIHALEVYHANLTKYVFWRWFREWCERAAPRYREQQLQRRTFNKWLWAYRENRERQFGAETGFVRRSLQKVFRIWATKARIDVAGYHQADAFRKSRLLGMPLTHWHAEARLSPVANMVLRMRDWRIARSQFSIWQLRTRMVFRADAVNRMRTLQNAYSAWNELLRSQILAARVNERVVAEALYKWVIAQRYALMIRITQRRQKRNALQSFLTGTREKREILLSKEAQVVDARKQHLMELTLSCWKNRMTVVRAYARIALDFYDPKLKQDTIEAIRLKLLAKQKLETWAKNARFYFLMTRYLAVLRAASAERKKARERTAHARMRRKCKMNLARGVLYLWSHKRSENAGMCKKGEEIYNRKVKVLQHRLLDVWQKTASQRKAEDIEMSTRYERRLLDRHLGILIDTSRHLYSLQSRADQFYHLKMSEVCSAQLRRFSMRAFEMRRREQDADAMRDRHWNKHLRNIFRHWVSRTQSSVYKAMISDAPTERRQEKEPTDAGYATASNEDQPQSANENDLGATRKAEEWTAFEADLLEGSDWIPSLDNEPLATATPMPTPGYLNTPSKRAARAKALANLSTTPATPFRPPFAARLRAGNGNGNSPSQGRATSARRGGLEFKSARGSNVQNAEEDD